MDKNSVTSALTEVASALASGITLEPAQLLHAETLCLELVQNLSTQASSIADPRVAVAHAQLAEALSRQATRASIAAASTVETTAAHALHVNEFDDLRAGVTDFSAEPVFAPGRTLYQDAAETLASVLDLNYFEAARRISDAHLVHARADISGAACAPRFTLLAEHFHHHAAPSDPDLSADSAASSSSGSAQGWSLPDLHQLADPREVLKIARALDKFEPADTTFDGSPTSATATAPDGVLLEVHAAEHLNIQQVRTRQKQLNSLVKAYKDAHGETKAPKLGLFRGPVINGVHEFIVRVRSLDAEVWESLIAQADNKRTQAGAAARQAVDASTSSANASSAGSSDSTSATGKADPEEKTDEKNTSEEKTGDESTNEQRPDDADEAIDPLWHSDDPIPDWARSDAAHPPNEDPPEPPDPPDPLAPPAPNKALPTMPSTCSIPERRLNALNAVLRNVDPDSAGKRVTPEIVVHANYADLCDLASLQGITAHRVKLSGPELRTMLCEAKVLSPIYNADGVIMDIGRDARLFPRWMKLAARDRDGGCLVPGCTTEPALLEFHHYTPWAKGGHTRLQDCCPLCTKHHVMVHSGYLKLVKIKGLPYVILPKHLDPEQVPRRNTYFART